MRPKKIFFIFPVALFFIVPLLVKFLWNNILVAVLSVKSITYWQAAGIFILSRLLFGSFSWGKNHHHPRMREKIMEKFSTMSDAERQQFKEEWHKRNSKC